MRKALIVLGILDDSDIEWMIRVGTKQTIAAGTTIIHEGKEIDALFIVLSGNMAVVAHETQVALLSVGEVVGEMSLIDARPPSATVTAAEESVILSIPRDEIDARLSDDIGFAARLYRALAVFLSSRLRTTVSHLGFGKSRLDESVRDEDEIPMDLLENITLAGIRFTHLQEHAKGAR
jgi:CRP/FNR family transcriptional regulator, cyclic AMP receptor protein